MRRAIRNLAALGATIFVCYGLQQTKPRYSDLTGPIAVNGVVDEAVDGRTFSIKLDRLTLANNVSRSRFGKLSVYSTSGVWIIIEATLAATTSTTVISEAVLKGPTGLEYRQSRRLGPGSKMAPHRAEPGLPKSVLFFFEVPRNQVRGSTLLVSENRVPRLDAQVRIGLEPLLADPTQGPTPILDAYRLP
ncbi:hypothetical protein IB262_33325 [Ensifer sp. ENS02]|uniref:hypothetical protein n=1 Tax=Ensifer sp. ENS02 TaxID=2769290 RepID=UPI001785315E|nr:hypothetical protein [Ensifer sp. ENS02]MBD9524759.1 hypothetical protein [Ensifer sp. ENS02]